MEINNRTLISIISVLSLLGLLALTGTWLSAGSGLMKDRLMEIAMTIYSYFAACAVIFLSVKYILGAFQEHGSVPLKHLILRIAAIPFGIVLLIRLVPALVHDLINIFVLSLF